MNWPSWLPFRSGPFVQLSPGPIDLEVELAPFAGPLLELPADRTHVYRVFGHPGVGKVDRKWERVSMVKALDLPGTWNKNSRKLYVHRLAEPYVREGLRRCRLLGCLQEITSIGCWNFRHQRHDAARPLSYHAWGIALDLNSDDNAGWYVEDVEPWSPEWLEHYPRGLSQNVVRAFESCGWRWGGRWRDGFVDAMHMCLTNG